jgi:hypothetical protein
MSGDGLYERYTWRGAKFDRLTIAALLAVDKRLGYEQHITQGSFSGSVSASAGTHSGSGAVDIVWIDMPRKTRAFRRVGWAFWPRPALPGVWGAHGHGILIGNERASAGAKAQVSAYKNGRNGLANNGRDPYWRPRKIRPFNYKRAALVDWGRLNKMAGHKNGRPHTREGARQVEVIAWALKGFGMNLGAHKKGHMDPPLLDAIERFRRIRKVGETEVKGPLSPKVCYELCVPTVEEK